MKTIEDIKTEYDSYKSKINTINNLEELEAYVLVLIDDIDNDIRVLKKDERSNKCYIMANHIIDLSLIFDTENLSYYESDNSYISEGYIICGIYKNHYKRLIKHSNEYNFKEMGKLAEFIRVCYKNDLDYLYSQRDNLDYTMKGYGYIDTGVEDNSLVACDFIYGKIEELSQIKGIEKTKKM